MSKQSQISLNDLPADLIKIIMAYVGLTTSTHMLEAFQDLKEEDIEDFIKDTMSNIVSKELEKGINQDRLYIGEGLVNLFNSVSDSQTARQYLNDVLDSMQDMLKTIKTVDTSSVDMPSTRKKLKYFPILNIAATFNLNNQDIAVINLPSARKLNCANSKVTEIYAAKTEEVCCSYNNKIHTLYAPNVLTLYRGTHHIAKLDINSKTKDYSDGYLNELEVEKNHHSSPSSSPASKSKSQVTGNDVRQKNKFHCTIS